MVIDSAQRIDLSTSASGCSMETLDVVAAANVISCFKSGLSETSLSTRPARWEEDLDPTG